MVQVLIRPIWKYKIDQVNELPQNFHSGHSVQISGNLDLIGCPECKYFENSFIGSFSYKIALATCATTGSNNPVFDRIREESPLFYLMLGDFHYGNIYRDCEDNFLTYFRATLGSKKQSKLYQNTAIAYMWDDHDFGPNNSSGISPNKDGRAACRPEALSPGPESCSLFHFGSLF